MGLLVPGVLALTGLREGVLPLTGLRISLLALADVSLCNYCTKRRFREVGIPDLGTSDSETRYSHCTAFETLETEAALSEGAQVEVGHPGFGVSHCTEIKSLETETPGSHCTEFVSLVSDSLEVELKDSHCTELETWETET